MTTEEVLQDIEENDIGYIFSYNIVLKQNIFTATEYYKDVQYIYDAI
jgi:hypothetical protein